MNIEINEALKFINVLIIPLLGYVIYIEHRISKVEANFYMMFKLFKNYMEKEMEKKE